MSFEMCDVPSGSVIVSTTIVVLVSSLDPCWRQMANLVRDARFF